MKGLKKLLIMGLVLSGVTAAGLVSASAASVASGIGTVSCDALNSTGETVGYVASMYISGIEAAKSFTATGLLTGADISVQSTPSSSGTVLGTSAGQAIADYAQQFAGSKYVYGASSPKAGFDCSGFVYYVYGKFGYSISRTATQQFKNNTESVSKENLQPGDLVFFQYGGKIVHVGMYIGDNRFIHACDSKTGVIISSLDSHWGTTAWYGAKRIVS